MADTDFIPAIEKWTPGLLDEVRGIAEGAKLPFEEVYVFQLADEIWSMGAWAMREKCTAIAVDRRGDQPTLVAQNMDIPGLLPEVPDAAEGPPRIRSGYDGVDVPGIDRL